jgi:predicted phage terminase large subunit-like protein
MVDKDQILALVKKLPPSEQASILKLLDSYDEAERIERAQSNFLDFVKETWDGFILGAHHKRMCEAFDRVINGESNRLIINLPPRHTKSELASIRLPAYFLGRHPEKKVIAASHTADLAVNFGRKVRDLIMDSSYQRVFPNTHIKQDAKAAGKWVTTAGGEYYAVGVGGALAGRGGDLVLIDDPHSEQDAMQGEWSPEVWEKAFDWFNTGPRQRLQPGGKIVIVMTRWATRDLTGLVLKKAMEYDKASEWEVIELPAILPSGNPLWPEYWSLDELSKVKADIPLQRWNAQYQQHPTASEGAILKREYWKRFTQTHLPKCEMILQSWDTAYGMKQRNDYSDCTTWGVWERETEEGKTRSLILLDYFKEKMEFPALKRKVRELYKKWGADTLIVEAKAAGAPLIFELRSMGIPVSEYTPARGNDKIVRANAITDMFKSGMIWAPETKWADELIEECNAFPNGDCDDGVDTLTQALLRFRQGGLIATSSDDKDDNFPKRKRASYY